MTNPDDDERAYVSRLWAEDWDSPEDTANDHLDAMVVEAAELGLYDTTAEPRDTR